MPADDEMMFEGATAGRLKAPRAAVGDTLRLMRERRGLQVKQVAELLGRSSGYVSKAERGGTTVSGVTLDKYATVLDVPPALLCHVISEQPPEGIHFRAQTVPQSRRHRVIAEANFIAWLLNRMMTQARVELDFPLTLPAYDTDLMDGGAAEAAQLLRRRWRIRGPVRDIAGLLEQAGVFVLPMPPQVTGIDAVTVRTNGPVTAVILLSDDVPEDRKRHSLAHELAHLVLDDATMSRSIRDDEDRADAFAGEFLAPYEELRPTVSNIVPAQLEELEELRALWGVSVPALIRRAFINQDLSESQYRYWFRVLNARNMVRARRSSSYPVRPRAAGEFLTALRESGYSANDIAEITDTGLGEMQEIFGEAWPFVSLRPRLRVVASAGL
ncbi:helix-turn-helix domain-containing protein [Nocardia sp. NPDC059091]|uniref:helix-turn-helix domain-containing protein n=1 Tax=unclassified Nocardia TaxID=2637762 RepID=UPI0036BC7010